MISKEELEELYRLRGLATDKEREIEDRIFQPDAIHTELEVERLISQYRKAKKARASASIDAAKAFMRATPEVRKAAEWRKFTPGHEDDIGRGASPVQSDETDDYDFYHPRPTDDDPMEHYNRLREADPNWDRPDSSAVSLDDWAKFRGGLQNIMSKIVIFENGDKTNVRIVFPSDKRIDNSPRYWVVINPHTNLEQFCDAYQCCDTSVSCCEVLASDEVDNIYARFGWDTNHKIKLGRERMLKIIEASSWACLDAYDMLSDIAF